MSLPSDPSRRWRSERGSVTLWGIGLTLVLFGFAGVVVDAWRAFAVRQDLAGMADSAAAAGATALDEDAYRASGAVVLDPGVAQSRAAEYLGRQEGFEGADIGGDRGDARRTSRSRWNRMSTSPSSRGSSKGRVRSASG